LFRDVTMNASPNAATAAGIVLGALLTLAVSAPIASAQRPAPATSATPTTPQADVERPGVGLFGRKPSSGHPFMNLELSAYAGHDDDVLAEQGGGSSGDPRAGVPGKFGGGRAALEYEHPGRRVSVAFSGVSAVRQLPARLSSVDRLSLDGALNGSVTAVLSPVWTSRGEQQGGYVSMYGLLPTPALVPGDDAGIRAGAADFIATDRSAYTVGTRGALTRRIGRRSSWSAQYERRGTYVRNGVDRLSEESLGTAYEHPITRYATLHLGYTHAVSDNRLLSNDGSLVLHTVDAGIRYERRPSFSRHTRFAFTTGSAIMQRSPGRRAEGMFVRLLGSATVHQEIGRSWTLYGSYERASQFVDTLPGLLSSDSTSTGLTGNVGRRFEIAVDGGYTTGVLSLGSSDNALASYTGSARLRTALNHYLAFDATYMFYHYQFDGPDALAASLRAGVRRQGLRAGLTLRVPLAGKRSAS
jgi:hypothetical protein